MADIFNNLKAMIERLREEVRNLSPLIEGSAQKKKNGTAGYPKIKKLRTSNDAHPQMKEIAQPLLKEFKKQVPVIFDDIVYKEE